MLRQLLAVHMNRTRMRAPALRGGFQRLRRNARADRVMRMPLRSSTCSQSSVARLPMGIIASRTSPCASLAWIDKAPISTLGMLFMTEDSNAAISPVPMAALHSPCCARRSNRWVSMSVRPAFFSPYTTRANKPISNTSSTQPPTLKVARSWIASFGIFRAATSYCLGISRRKNRNSTSRVADTLAKFTGTITEAYSLKPNLK
ncbi:hypothetical protein WR25_22206 [Diploscapter pachys]|uniref:Uncharacterized protein n=1 Tax=Diploscapter pachys TaxID=2018661 RepID=A0A2A2K6N7_9BILA|nr:hypothetical protein WR25_22206 [Diploscapter pachys]